MAYHVDVEYLDECSPALIERNAAELGRTRDLLVSVEPSVHKARYGTVWESVHRRNFDTRLADVSRLVTELAEGFGKARTALVRYADEVEAAKQHLENGVDAEHTLGSLISQVAVPVTRTQWDDIRETTGFLDWLAELGMAADSIREDATRAYNQADDAFGRAQSVERAAREECLAELSAAYAALPDCRGDAFRDAAELAGQIAPLRAEAAQAGTDPHVGLPGSGVKGADFPVAAGAAVSPALQHIRTLLKSLPEGQSPWWHNITLARSSPNNCPGVSAGSGTRRPTGRWRYRSGAAPRYSDTTRTISMSSSATRCAPRCRTQRRTFLLRRNTWST
ncbi:MAG: hypothetical protein ACRDTE_00810 [Pseudonocardiaceae bacterium]